VRWLLAVIAVAVLLGSACRRSAGDQASCDAVGVRFLAIAHDDLARKGGGLDPELRDGVAGLLAPMRDAIVRACRRDGWAAPARGCFAAATSEVEFRACAEQLSGEQRTRLEQSSARGIQPTP